VTEPCRYRWLRIAAIAAGAIILASCRSLTAPALLGASTLAVTADPAAEPPAADPCACRAAACPAPACPPPPPVPTVGPCLVCDGGDHGAPARPTRRLGVQNLTAGDTVARYRPADAAASAEDSSDDELAEVRIAVSGCACVYAPRFASVREVLQPHERAAPAGPRGLAADAETGAATDVLPVASRAGRLAPLHAREAQVGLVVEERLPALAVDQAGLPGAAVGGEAPAERTGGVQPAHARRTHAPRIAIGFDVPFAWTCVRGAQVTVAGQAAEVIAADRGTATLRLEAPGRAELTLCKRAGSDTARAGEELDFTIFLLNSGDRPLADVVLVDALPARLELVPRTAAASLPADISTGTGDDGCVVVTWRFTGTLAPGDGGFVRFRTIVR